MRHNTLQLVLLGLVSVFGSEGEFKHGTLVSFKSDDVRCEYGFEADIENPIGVIAEPGTGVFEREHVENNGNKVSQCLVSQIISDKASDDITAWVPRDELQTRKQYRSIFV